MEHLEKIITLLNDFLWSKLLVYVLVLLGIYFTLRTRFVQIRNIGEMIRLMGDGIGASVKGKKGVSSFQAFCISTASRVGVGNLAGVAMAISLGGPGAVFWMWLIAILGSASAFVESTLAQIYKVKDKDVYRGGPAYYMQKGLNARWMGIIFAILITFCFGLVFNSVQANTLTLAFNTAFHIDRVYVGIAITILLAVIIFGGVKRIAKAAELTVPFMAVAYILVALYIIIMNYDKIPTVFTLIIKNAFGLEAAFGGGVGAAILQGIKRGLFSNEAGMGSAPNAAATAEVTHPVKQGFIQALSVFTDTLLVCSATALIILFSGNQLDSKLEGIQLTQNALATQMGAWAPGFVTIAILFFAFTSLIGNYYYGETNIEFIKESKGWLFVYRVAVIVMVLWGSMAKVQLVWDLADLFMALMAITNLIAITLLGRVAFAALKDYLEQRKQGKDPVFYASRIKGLENVECWKDEKEENIG
ncbi:alanine/glycine:cation symporter family protein [Thermoflavimicrobium daqui]|uniref:Sodium:alanine symporter family protein n=1 Tax=Thermoflavimicrobium daqui TaxID=2137476 RepID=A0A364K2F0_9BACL|nr:alanine/glycine:cation symporter family protein [Thermoflavimicrobium daqui]RAL22608.1 sodium:alanine symporter family protein [Thermoflavimicrobium daqui]